MAPYICFPPRTSRSGRPRSPPSRRILLPDDVRLTPAQAEQIVDAIGRALEDADSPSMNWTELSSTVGSWAGDRVMPAFQDMWPRWRQAVGGAAHRGVLCFGPNKGRRVTYQSAPLDPWIQAGTGGKLSER